jgi:hypothetical protein
MQDTRLSSTVQLGMYFLRTFFWIFNLIPFVNIFSNALDWIIWAIVFVYIYLPLLRKIAANGVSIGNLYAKINIVSFIAFILGCIPIVSMIPWNLMVTAWINRQFKLLHAKVEELVRDTKKLKQGWQNRQRTTNMRQEMEELQFEDEQLIVEEEQARVELESIREGGVRGQKRVGQSDTRFVDTVDEFGNDVENPTLTTVPQEFKPNPLLRKSKEVEKYEALLKGKGKVNPLPRQTPSDIDEESYSSNLPHQELL